MAIGGARVSIEDLDEEFGLGKLIGTYRLTTPLTVFTRIAGGTCLVLYALVAPILTGNAETQNSAVRHGLLLVVLAVVIALLIGSR